TTPVRTPVRSISGLYDAAVSEHSFDPAAALAAERDRLPAGVARWSLRPRAAPRRARGGDLRARADDLRLAGRRRDPGVRAAAGSRPARAEPAAAGGPRSGPRQGPTRRPTRAT